MELWIGQSLKSMFIRIAWDWDGNGKGHCKDFKESQAYVSTEIKLTWKFRDV